MHSQHCTHLACQARSKTFRRKRSKMGRSHPAHCTMADPPRPPGTPPPPPGPPDKASPGVRVWRGPTLPADRSTAGLYVDAGVVDVVSRPRRAPTIKTMFRRVSVFSSNRIIVTVRRNFQLCGGVDAVSNTPQFRTMIPESVQRTTAWPRHSQFKRCVRVCSNGYYNDNPLTIMSAVQELSARKNIEQLDLVRKHNRDLLLLLFVEKLLDSYALEIFISARRRLLSLEKKKSPPGHAWLNTHGRSSNYFDHA